MLAVPKKKRGKSVFLVDAVSRNPMRVEQLNKPRSGGSVEGISCRVNASRTTAERQEEKG